MPKQPALKYTKSQSQEFLREQEASGLTLPNYCKKHGLPYDRFVYWRRKLQGPARTHRRQTLQPGVFVPVVVKSETAAPEVPSSLPTRPRTPTSMDVLLRCGHAIRVTADFDLAALCRLVAAMEATSC